MANRSEDYKRLDDLAGNYHMMRYKTFDLISIINEFPEGITREDLKSLYRIKLNRVNRKYRRGVKWLSIQIAKYKERINDSDYKSTLDTAEAILNVSFFSEVEDFGTLIEMLSGYKLSQVLINRDDYLNSLVFYKNKLKRAKALALAGLTAFLQGNEGGYVRDKRIKVLKQKILNALDDPTITGSFLDKETTVETEQNKLSVNYNKSVEEVNNFKNRVSDIIERPADAVQEIILDTLGENRLFKRLFKRLTYAGIMPAKSDKNFEESFEGYWRDRIRKKYGGNVPFCDEVDEEEKPIEIKGIFYKREEVINIGSGIYLPRTEATLEALRKAIRNSNYDAY